MYRMRLGSVVGCLPDISKALSLILRSISVLKINKKT